MTARAPAVVAVLVTRDPGPWFDETLQALASQDYPDLSVLVLVSDGSSDPAGRVARYLPDAFVRHLPADRGYAAGVDEALAMVEGASFFLLCHDDCAPAPDAVHLMVQESFRSNAGVVAPKMVHWSDTAALLHVGQQVDKTGAVVERIVPGEIDAGQHDAVRDVFVAPGGCTLVRSDLFRALGGYDPSIVAMGEDLDLSWRAHVAGARVVVAPSACVRHLEVLAGGARHPAAGGGHRRGPSLQALERRHELRAVLVCYSWPHLLRVLPQAFALALGEIVVALLVRDWQRARAVVHAWEWNARQLGALHRRRAMVAASRSVPDADLRSLQVRGSARLATYLSRLTHQGVQVAHGLHRVPRGGSAPAPAGAVGAGAAEGSCEERVGTAGSWVPPLPTAVIGTAFSEDADVDDLDDLGRRAGSYRRGAPASHRVLATPRARLAGWLVVVAVLVIGSRGLLGSGLPVIGQFVPFSGWATTWGHVFSGWQTAGTGSGAPSSPAWALLGLAGTAVAGRMGFLQEALVLGCVPVGAWGVSRLLGPFASVRGRFAGVVTYLALPLAYDALARGRWVGLIAYAAVPWIVGHLAKATGLPPFDGAPSQRSLWWRSLALGGVEALAVAFAPATSVVVVVCAAGIALGSSVAGGWHGAWRAVRVAGGATVVTAVAFAPWVAATLASGRSAFVVLGLAGNPHGLPGWGGLLRLDVGPIGGSPLSWLPIAAAAVPLLVARRCRWEWSARLWGVAGVAWIVAVVSAKAWAVPFAPDVDVLLAPAAVALASGAGLAVAAFESDVADFRFGWRQALAAAGVAAVALAAVPVLVGSTGGRWDAPGTGFGQAVAFPVVHRPSDGYRVLWLGDPQVLPAGWPIAPGLAYTMSANGMPAASDLWLPAAPPRTAGVVRGVTEALRGETVDLGRLLAPAHIRFVAVVGALAPQTPGVQTAPVFPVPGGLVAALARQGDLRTVPISAGGITVFENADRLALQPADVTVAPAGAARPLDAWWAAIELVLWVLVALSLLDVRRRLAHRWTTGQVRRHHVTRRAHRSESPVVLPADAHADGTAPAAEMDPGRASAPHPPSFSAASGPAAPCETLVAPPSGGDGR